MFTSVDVDGPPKILTAVFFLFCKEVSIYPSATELLFQPPCLFIMRRSAPESAKSDVEDRLKQCPVYCFGSGSFKNSAISFGAFPIVFIPIGCLI